KKKLVILTFLILLKPCVKYRLKTRCPTTAGPIIKSALSGERIKRSMLIKLFRWKIMPCFILSRSEEHTSELQSRFDLVCRVLLEKKNGAGFAPHAVRV